MSKKPKEVQAAAAVNDAYTDQRIRNKYAGKERGEFAFPMAGNTGGQDYMWRALTSPNAQRDLNPVTQKRMQEIAFYLFDTNPMGHRLIEIISDFVVGDGFTWKAEDDKVAEVIEDFWNDPDNDLDNTIDENTMELGLFGELTLPVWVNKIDGHVKLGYIDPCNVSKVFKSKKFPRINERLFYKYPRQRKERQRDIILTDRNPKSKTQGKLIGDCFFFTINKPISATRGRSDLLSLADWLDGHDQFLFARLERAFLLNSFIWDVECEGMNQTELDNFVKTLPIPKPGSIRAHNEKIKWTAVAPKLEGQDASNEARLFKNQILGGAGYPEHWFAEGSKTTRATAQEMGLPTLKRLKKRQRIVKNHYKYVINFVIDQAIIAGTLPENVNRKFKIIPSPIVSKDSKQLAQVMKDFVEGLGMAQEKEWITAEEAKESFRALISQIGVESLESETGEGSSNGKKETESED